MENTQKKDTKPKIITFLLNALRGVTLGISAAVPGLSAGTIAVAERCYDPLIGAISDLRKKFKDSFLYLLPYGLGMIIGALLALIGIQRGYEVAPFTLVGFFAGFIIGSLPVSFAELKRGKTKKEVFFHLLALILTLILTASLGIVSALTKFSFEEAIQNREWWTYILMAVAGLVAAGACIIPGVSGSMSLMVLGVYFPILNTFTGESSIFHKTGDTTFLVTGLAYALILVVFAVIGVLLVGKTMKHLLEKHRVTTFYAITGLILGSLISMFINADIYPKYPEIYLWDYITGAILLVAIAVGSFFFFKKYAKKNSDAQGVSADENN